MKKIAILAALSLFAAHSYAATSAQPDDNDPVIMRINGQPVLRSEFEYSYNKNNSEGVIDKKSLEEYVDLFINYRVQLVAALEAKYDTVTAFREEYAQYRDEQVLSAIVTEADIEAEAHHIYDQTVQEIGPDGLIRAAHILIRAEQQAPQEEWDKARVRIDSIYKALQEGADFAELARQLSQDPGSARQGGEMTWTPRGRFVKEFEEAAFALQPGEMSGVVQTAFGYHIILMKDRKMLEPFEFYHDNLLRFIEQRNLRKQIALHKVDSLVQQAQQEREEVMTQQADLLAAQDSDLYNLLHYEYHDGLLVYNIRKDMVYDKATQDEKGLAAFFKKHKKNYAWDEPRFKGIVYRMKEAGDVKAVKAAVKKLPFTQWKDTLNTRFNADSTARVHVDMIGLFRRGDNAIADSLVFYKDTTVTHLPDYPLEAVEGHLLKKGPEDYTDVRGLVVADYQEFLEQQWVAQLRKKYAIEVDQNVVKTVNNH